MSPRSINVIVTGASGLLGRAVYQYLTDAEFRAKYPLEKSEAGTSVDQEFVWNCLGLCFSRSKGNLRKCDLTNLEELDQLVDEFKPDAILHCAAERRVENVENNFEKAMLLNKGTTEHLAETCAKRGIMFVYISTDYVFDGANPPYKENSPTSPLNKYGLSKLSGEQVTIKASENHCVVRVTVLYGYTEANKSDESAVNMLIEKTRRVSEPFKVDNFQVRYPVHTIDVARFLTQLMRKRFNNNTSSSNEIRGIFHCRGDESFTKYAMACVMADLYGLGTEHIVADMSEAENKTEPRLRPDNPLLDTTHSYSLINYRPILSFRNSIKDCLEHFVD